MPRPHYQLPHGVPRAVSAKRQYVRWNRDEFDPDPLVARLENLRKPDESGSGNVVFEGDLFFDDIVTVLERAVIFSETMPERDQRRIVSQALFAVAESGPLTAGKLLGEINRGARGFAETPEGEFVLATSLSVRNFREMVEGKYDFSEASITIGYRLPEHLRSQHETAKERMRDYIFGEYPDSGSTLSRPYAAVWIEVSGRSVFEAAEKALGALDLLRGMWNFALNRRRWTQSTNERRKPVNKVLLGPVQSLHHPDGSLASAVDWYEYDYVEPIRGVVFKSRWEMAKKEEEGIRACLARSFYRPEIEEAIKRYTRALDLREWDSAFVRMWGLLEDLTGTESGDHHGVTVKRAAFLYPRSERDLHVQVLNHLRGYRNSSVHAGEGSADIEAYLYQLKRYVEEVLRFHVQAAWSYGFSSIKEAAHFLDQPPEPADLDRKITDLQKNLETTQERVRLAKLAREYHDETETGD